MDPAMLNGIIEYFNRETGIDAVYLFGSGAKGTMREKSDIDLAVLFNPAAGNKLSRFDRLLAMAGDLESMSGRHVDVVDIREVPPVLQHQILKHGRCIVEKDGKSRISFEVDSRRRYFDMKRVYYARNRAILALLKEG
ncbi:MAG: nucleotidyltransferase domain-containing protein [Firmicutes bacterium]|nr:nucleotidyltransferase domain-containing protein [Bacillota bacterium]